MSAKLTFTKYSKAELQQFQEEKAIIKNGTALVIEKGFLKNCNVSFMLTDKHLVMTKIPPFGLIAVGLIPWLILYLVHRRKTLVIPTAMMPIERSKYGLNKFVVAIVHMESGTSFKLVLTKKHFDTFVEHFSLKEMSV